MKNTWKCQCGLIHRLPEEIVLYGYEINCSCGTKIFFYRSYTDNSSDDKLRFSHLTEFDYTIHKD